MFDPSSVNFVIYHADCSDGFGAAWAAWKLLGDRATYYPATYGHPAPNVKGKTVVCLDFSYDNATTKRLISEADNFYVIDHHKTAMINLNDVSNTYFDMNHSGAYLSWKFFHPEKEVPRLIKYIEDRDIWKWELPYSKEFSTFFYTVPFEFDEYDNYLDDSVIDDAQESGSHIVAYTKAAISRIIKNPAMRKLGGKSVAVVNTSQWVDEIGNALAVKCDFAVIWRYDHKLNDTHVSLRSFHDDVDVSEVAKRFGGGGHKKSAAFRLPHDVFIESIFDKEALNS